MCSSTPPGSGPSAGPCDRDGRRVRRPCLPRRQLRERQGRSRSGWADRRRSTAPSDLWPGWSGRGHSTPWPSSAPSTCASPTACPGSESLARGPWLHPGDGSPFPRASSLHCCRGCPPVLPDLLLFVVEEALTRLPAQQLSGDHAAQQGHRRIVGIAEFVVERIQDGQGRIQTDQVEESEGPHGKPATTLHSGVDIGDGGHSLLVEADRVVQVWEQEGVDDESGLVFDLDGSLSTGFGELAGRPHCFIGCRDGRTNSTRVITGAGLKKWTPHTLSGRPVCMASSTTGSVEVLVAKMVLSSVTRSSSLKSSFLTAKSSTTDSMTRSTSLSAERSEVPVTRARAASRSSSLFLPFSTCRFSDFSRAAKVASAVAWLRERKITSKPLTATASAIPEPMIPEPTIPTRAIDMGGDVTGE